MQIECPDIMTHTDHHASRTHRIQSTCLVGSQGRVKLCDIRAGMMCMFSANEVRLGFAVVIDIY
jgi:hypothetical protein